MNWAEYSKSRFEKCKQSGTPFHACFELTPFCNFRCNMCYVRLDPEQAQTQGKVLSTRQWLDIAKEAKKLGTFTLEVTGGEAITRPDFCLLYESFIKMGYLIILRTNGYLVDRKILELLKQYKPRKVSVTLYGASDQMYENVCGISDGFTVVTRNILAMKEAGLNVRLSMTVTNDNVGDLKVLKQWAEENGLPFTAFGGLISPVRSAKRDIEHLRIDLPEEECEMDDGMQKLADAYEIKDLESLMNPFWMCRAFGAQFSISWDGRMTICNTFTPVWKEPLKTGLAEAYRSLYEDLRKLIRPAECNSCKYIEFCPACPSQLLSATGDAEKTCERICKVARRRFKQYMEMKTKQGENRAAELFDNCPEGDLYEN